jgi:chorismate mutase
MPSADAGASIDERAAVVQAIGKLKHERDGLIFTPTTQAAVDDARAAVAKECGKVGINCRTREDALKALNVEHGKTERANEIARELKTLDSRLASLPVLAKADSQVDAALRVIPWLTRGHVTPAPGDIEMIRLLGVALPTISGGLLIAIAMALVQPAGGKRRQATA